MISASSLKTPLKILIAAFTAALSLSYSSFAFAQYTPPPMFEDMGTNSARPNADSGNIVKPKASPITPQTAPPAPRTERAPVILPRVSVDPDKNPRPPVTPYIPSIKKMEPIVEPKKKAKPKPTAKPAVKPEPKAPVKAKVPEKVEPTSVEAKSVAPPVVPAAPEPEIDMTAPIYSPIVKKTPEPVIDLTAPTKPSPMAMPAAKVKSQGVVTGPKTMPAVPTTNVDQIETFDDSSIANEPTIMERNLQAKKREQAKKEATLTPIVPPAKPAEEKTIVAAVPGANAKPMDFDSAKPEVMKKILPYQAGQVDLAKADLDAITAGVRDELKLKPDWRIQIRSFATPQGEGLSSDRRIALSRALSIRTALVANGIDASQIDLRADGLQSDDSQTRDRVDLYLYNPAEPVQTP